MVVGVKNEIINFGKVKTLREELQDLFHKHQFSILNEYAIRNELDYIVKFFSNSSLPNYLNLDIKFTRDGIIKLIPENLYTTIILAEENFTINYKIPEFGTFETYLAEYSVFMNSSGVIENSIRVKGIDETRDNRIDEVLNGKSLL